MPTGASAFLSVVILIFYPMEWTVKDPSSLMEL